MKVLLIDEDLDSRESARDMILELIESVEEFLEVSTAREAIELIDEHGDIDLVISEYETTDLTGGHVFSHLIKMDSQVPFISRSEHHPENYSEFDGYRVKYLPKPDHLDHFSALIDDMNLDEDEDYQQAMAASA